MWIHGRNDELEWSSGEQPKQLIPKGEILGFYPLCRATYVNENSDGTSCLLASDRVVRALHSTTAVLPPTGPLPD